MTSKLKKALMGTKVGMTQVFDETGRAIPVTVVEASPNVVLQKKTLANDGYNALQVGYGEIRERLVNQPETGHFKKAKVKPLRYVREFRIDNVDDYDIGDKFNVDLFTPGDIVDVAGTSKGKGFAGAVKRHNFSRGAMGHGSKYHRGPGSLAAKGPARVFKGRKLPGRLGGERVTVQCLQVVKVYPEKNLILIKGSIPGPRKGLVIIKNSVKA